MTQHRPNILYVFADEHRWQSMGHTELPQLRTPAMDNLARQGTSFTQCISNYPVCSPHRAMLMTGAWPFDQGVVDNGIALGHDRPTIGKAFRSAGYATGYIGKWHLGGTRAEPLGFDHSQIWTNVSRHWNSCWHPADGLPIGYDGYNTTGMTDQAIDYLRRRDPGRPFLLMLSLNTPHSRFTDAPEQFLRLYPDQAALPCRGNLDLQADVHMVAGGGSSLWDIYRGYHAHVSAGDGELARLLGELDALGLSDDTVVIYTSDHGSMVGSNGHEGKRLPHAESIRVPFIIRWPGRIAPAVELDDLFGSIDIAATLCGLAGVTPPAGGAGRDLSGLILHGSRPAAGQPGADSQFIMHIAKDQASGGLSHPAPLFRGVTTGRHTWAATVEGAAVLFDNVADPLQRSNLASDPATFDLQRHLHRLTADWLARAKNPFQLPALQ
ncbi:MAG: hypothetical protein BIFFINMI_02024 [Phycisphaerae bacterium]|nr:hypothetical protein [Phycisphaerae bacterium]